MSAKQTKIQALCDLYQVGDFIDAKDNQGDWRVGYIIDKSDANKMFKIRFDGWASKYDQFFKFGHPKLRQFRSVVLGYTGQKQNPALRPGWKFSLIEHQKKLIELHNYVAKNSEQKINTVHDYNQWIRGHNYFFVDFLMTLTYTRLEQIHKVIEFLKVNIIMATKYLKYLSQNFANFIETIQRKDEALIQDVQVAKSFAFYEIFDMIYTITGSYQRMQGFFKQNQQLLREELGLQNNRELKHAYQVRMVQFFHKNEGFQHFDQIIKQINQSKRPVSFILLYSLAHLYSGISCVIQTKSKQNVIKQFKAITEKSIELLGDKQLKDLSHHEILEVLNEISAFSIKTSLQRDIVDWVQNSQMQIYFKMITCPFFQKKLRGITSLHEFVELRLELIADGTIERWIQQKKLFDVLFSNDNPELIKKSTQFLKLLYTKDNDMQKYIPLVWKYRQGKHETALKQIYNFMGDVPIYDKNQQFTVQLFKKHLSSVDEALWDADYIKMIKDYTVNAIFAWSGGSISQTFGFKIIYKYLQKNQADSTLLSYLIQILQKLQKSQFLQKFMIECFICVQKRLNQSFHISLLLRILKQKIADMRSINIEARQIIQTNIVLSKNLDNQNLHEQFDLLNEILKQAKQIIPEQDFIKFWNEMIDSKGKTYFFKWIYKVRDTGRVFLTNYINIQTKQFLLGNFWTQEYLKQHPQFDEFEAVFLLELFKSVNANEDRIKRVNFSFEVLDENLTGIERLHCAYQLCKNKKAEQILSKGLAEIYMSGGDSLAQLDVDLIHSLIVRIIKQIKTSSQKDSTEGIKKQIRLIEQILLRDQQIYEPNQNLRSYSFKDFTVKNAENNQSKILKCNIIHSVYDFKKIIAEKFGLSLYKFDLVVNEKQVVHPSNYFKSVGQIDIKGVVLLKLRSSEASKVKIQLNHHLELLFELLGNKQIQERVWNIVSKLPISNQIRQKIVQSQNPLKILQNASFYKELYMFKVALSLEKKWWNIQVSDMISFFVSRLQKTSATTEIQRQYIMVSSKILQKVVQSDEISTAKLFSETFTAVFQIIKKILVQTNKIQSLNTFYIKKFIETFFSIGEMHNKFLQKKKLKATESDALSLLLNDQKIEDLLKLCLIQYRHESIRKQFPVRLVKLASVNREKYCDRLAGIILNELLDYSVQCQAKSLKEYNSFSCFILESMSSYLQKFFVQNKAKFFNKLFRLIENQSPEENSDLTNISLQCYMSLIRYVIQQVSQKELQKLFGYVYGECLFKGNQSKCKSKDTRTAAFNLLQKFIKYQKNQPLVLQTFGKLHQNGIWRSRKLEDWAITSTDRLKSSTGYTGLRNLGCICYMNSFFQQIFMIQQFRLSLLLADDPSYNPQQTGQNVLYQVKKMFLNLMYSDKKAYSPKSFCMSFKDYEGNPTNVTEQMDIDEFSGILFDRLQNSLKGTKYSNLIKDTFGGVFSNQIICKGCPHFSQSQESFLSLSLTVKDKKSVYESLQTMIKGDTLDGDNAYHCERCDKKVSAVKRVCLKSLPDYLIVTMKRFQFDFNTMTKLKVNEYCEFPHQINLQEYSYEYLRKKQNPKAFQGEQLKSKKYYEYRLKGVVIHLGYADSGHYYSLIQQRRGQQRWLQFNDTLVKKFNVQNLHEEAFGGQTGGPQSKQKIKNAYMLIYERVQKINSIRQDVMRGKNSLKNLEMYDEIFTTIGQQNSQYNIESILFSVEYVRFISLLIDEAGKNKNNFQLQKFCILAFLTVITRSKCDPGTFQTLQKIYSSFGSDNTKLNEWILQQFSDLRIFEQFFRNCPIRETKRSVAMWISQVLRQTKDTNIKTNFYKSIAFKITVQNQNTIEPLMILHSLADQDHCLQFLIQHHLIGRMLENIIRKQPRLFGSLNDLTLQRPQQSFFGYEQIVQKSAFELKKFKYENDSGIVWALAYKIMKKFTKKQLQSKLSIKQMEYLYLNKDKIYKLLEQVKSKFDIDVLTDYLCYLSFENEQFSEELANICEKGLKDFQSKRYRQFFILFSKIINVKDYMHDQRIIWFHSVLRGLKQNQKYAMDCTIIELWLCKLINENEDLRTYLMKQKSVLEYLVSLPVKKAPSDQLSKKNANFGQNCVNKYHGIPFPTSRRGYLKLLTHVEDFYEKLLKLTYEPIPFFESGNHCAYDKLSVGDKIAYFDIKDKVDYQEATIKEVFLDKLCISRKSAPNKLFWVWADDQKLTSNTKVIKQDIQNELDSSKTTQMEDQIDFEAIN